MYTKDELADWAGVCEFALYYVENESQHDYTQKGVYYVVTDNPYYKEEIIRGFIKLMFPNYIPYEEYKKLPNDFASYLTYHYKLEQNPDDRTMWKFILIRPYDD